MKIEIGSLNKENKIEPHHVIVDVQSFTLMSESDHGYRSFAISMKYGPCISIRLEPDEIVQVVKD